MATRIAPTTRGRPGALAGLLVVAVAACTTSGAGDDTSTTETSAVTAATTEAASPATDPPEEQAAATPPGCPDPDAVGDLVGEAVEVSASGGGQASSDGISFSFSGCSYRVADGSGSVGVERVSWDGEGFAFDGLSDDARTRAEEEGFEPIDELGDEAWRDGTAIAALDGDIIVLAEVDPAPDDGPEVARALGEILAGAAVGLDLAADTSGDDLCDALEAAVADALGPVASARGSVGGMVVDDVDLTTTGCRLDLVDGAEAMVRVADGADWDPWVAAMRARSSDAGYAPFTIGQVSVFDTGAALVVDDGDEPLRITTDGLDIDPDDAAALRLDVAELALRT